MHADALRMFSAEVDVEAQDDGIVGKILVSSLQLAENHLADK